MVGRVVEQGWSPTKAAEAAELSDRTCAKRVHRYRAQGEPRLRDRSTASHRTSAERVEVIELLRRLRMTSKTALIVTAKRLSPPIRKGLVNLWGRPLLAVDRPAQAELLGTATPPRQA
jgi:transposase